MGKLEKEVNDKQTLKNLKINTIIHKKISKKNFTKIFEDFLKNIKNKNIICKDFISYDNKINKYNNLGGHFLINNVYLKNVYYKIKKNILYINLEDIYDGPCMSYYPQ